MRVLWIVNIPIGKLCDMAKSKPSTGGSWLRVAHEAFFGSVDVDIAVATTWGCDKLMTEKVLNFTYYLAPGGAPSKYDYLDKNNTASWQQIREGFKPDAIVVWGTEFTHALAALRVMKDVPSAVYIQGVVANIAKYYYSGLTQQQIRRNFSLRDIIKNDTISSQKRRFEKQSSIEADLLNISNNIIVENLWCASQCRKIAPNCRVFNSKLPIDKHFFEQKWNSNNTGKYTIMCNAGYYPIKGMHILLQALSVVKKSYPTVELRVPGMARPDASSIKKRLKSTGYSLLLAKMLCDLGLEKNVKFIGGLSSEQMAKEMSECNLFIMPSCVENHSSTLIEAMIVGAPCISSFVGGVPEVMDHLKTGLLYRYDEWEVLAAYINKLFDEPLLAITLGNAAREKMVTERSLSNIKEELGFVHKSLLK